MRLDGELNVDVGEGKEKKIDPELRLIVVVLLDIHANVRDAWKYLGSGSYIVQNSLICFWI